MQQQQHHLQQQQQQQHSKEQSESAMLFNYLYKSGTLPQAAYAQNAYGFTSEQMKQMQMYAGHNVDLLTSYYQQQQQYNQFLQVSVHYHIICIFLEIIFSSLEKLTYSDVNLKTTFLNFSTFYFT